MKMMGKSMMIMVYYVVFVIIHFTIARKIIELVAIKILEDLTLIVLRQKHVNVVLD